MDTTKDKVYEQLFEKYKETSSLDTLSTKYIFDTWKMTKEIHEHIKKIEK